MLGAGEGWAKSILFNVCARTSSARFFTRKDSFALGVCNGCQMMSNLHEIIPGAERWPRFVRNLSEQFEARVAMVQIPQNPSIFLRDMQGSLLPIVVAHGEGRAEFRDPTHMQSLILDKQIALCFVDNRGELATTYPYNPNGSPYGISGLTTPDGRFHHPDAAPRARLPHRRQFLASRRVGRGRSVAAHVPQRAGVGGLTAGFGLRASAILFRLQG